MMHIVIIYTPNATWEKVFYDYPDAVTWMATVTEESVPLMAEAQEWEYVTRVIQEAPVLPISNYTPVRWDRL